MRRTRTLVAVVFMLCVLTAYASAAGVRESIEVIRNQVSIQVNGRPLAADTFQYQANTYGPVQKIVEALGGKVTLDQATNTLQISTDSVPGNRQVSYPGAVDVTKPSFDLKQLGVEATSIDAFKMEQNGATVTAKMSFADGALRLEPNDFLSYNAPYTLKLFLNNGTRLTVAFKTGGLPSLAPGLTKRLVFVPAMPEKGFNYPYYMVVPSQASVTRNAGKRNYLMVETHNTGKTGDSLDFHIKEARMIAENNSASIADAMGLPRIVPILVRPESLFEGKAIYTHSLTRYTILLDQFKKGKSGYPDVFKPMDRVDLQVIAMIKHAQSELRSSGWQMEDRIFMWGYSASGSFTNHFSFLHPQMVKAACFGSFPIPPVATVGGTKMIYPLGTYDYKQITGRDFDLAAYNSVARLGYIGSEDHNNPTLAWDIWSPDEQAIIRSVLAVKEYPDQWNKYKAIYATSGGESQSSVYLGAKHETFYKGQGQDYLNFFRANRESDAPAYVKPSDPAGTLTDIRSKNIVEVKEEPFSYDTTTIIEAFWTGVEPTTASKEFVDWYKTLDSYTRPSDRQFMIAIAEWNPNRDHRQMGERLQKAGTRLTLRAAGKKDLTVELDGGSMNGWGTQVYFARVLNPNEMVSGIPYQIVANEHWIVPEGVVVVRP